MEEINYKETIRSLRVSKRLGQNFLMNKDIAKTEARFAEDKNVLEVGPGLGMLTRELCKKAKKVTAIEMDSSLYEILKSGISAKNIELINSDFFDSASKVKDCDIMIANIPYSISSKILGWLGENQMPAVLCLQKEFVDHMMAKHGSKNYSKLSVISSLQFKITMIMKVPSNNFYPQPKVDSSLIFVKPNGTAIKKNVLNIVSLIMEHKKKKVRNAVVDSNKALGITKEDAYKLVAEIDGTDKRAFQMSPEEIESISKKIESKLKSH